jgi:hypothetical protein
VPFEPNLKKNQHQNKHCKHNGIQNYIDDVEASEPGAHRIQEWKPRKEILRRFQAQK